LFVPSVRSSVREFAFELAVCAALEADSDGVVARQLGTHTRIVDVVEVRPGPEFDRRTEITPEAIPGPAIESDVGVGRARLPTEAIDLRPGRASAVADRAVDVGFFEAERRGGRRYVRRTTAYPAWIGGLCAFETNPTSAGRASSNSSYERTFRCRFSTRWSSSPVPT